MDSAGPDGRDADGRTRLGVKGLGAGWSPALTEGHRSWAFSRWMVLVMREQQADLIAEYLARGGRIRRLASPEATTADEAIEYLQECGSDVLRYVAFTCQTGFTY